MRVGLIGIGLIGGSMSRSLRKHGLATSVYGMDKSESNLEEAKGLGLIDDRFGPENMAEMDLIIVSTPVDVCGGLVQQVLDQIGPETIVVDMGSTKERICALVDEHENREQYVACHPIAGTENSGPSAAFDTLFDGKLMIICDQEKSDPETVRHVTQLFEQIGMHITMMSAASHDRHMAYVSHLSHVSSFMLATTVLDIEDDERQIFDLAGSGFASTVRLAKSTHTMWAPIFLENGRYVSEALGAYIDQLLTIKELIDDQRANELNKTLEQANTIRRVLNK